MAARPRLSIDPRRFRLSFAAAFAAFQALIWVGFATQFAITRASHVSNFAQRAEASIVVLEDHVSRSLDVAAARALLADTMIGLRGAGTTTQADLAAPAATRLLADLIADAPVIRSLSLVDGTGTVRASSNAATLGTILPPGALPAPGTADPARGLTYGSVVAGRDAGDLGAPAAADAAIWLASRAAAPGTPDRRWVVAIDLSFFSDLWLGLRADIAAELALFDLAANRILAHNRVTQDTAALGQRLVPAAAAQGRGTMSGAAADGLVVAFRGSATHPFVLAMSADRATLGRQHLAQQMPLLIGAALAAILISVALFFLYRWYLRYEASVIEMRNQSLVIGEHVMVSESDARGRIIDVNDAFLRACGYARREVIGQDHRMFNSGNNPAEFYRELWNTISAGRIWHGTLRNRNKSGRYFWVNATIIPFKDAWGRILRYVALYSDITSAVIASETLARERRMRADLSAANKALMTDIHTDHLTGIANRRGLEAFLAEYRTMPDATGEPITVLMLDIDHFKRINDGWGHAAGDAVLREAAVRWRAALRASDFIARMGGEEFCVLLPRTPAPSALFVAHKLCDAMRGAAFTIRGPEGPVQIDVTVSIGLAATRLVPDLDLQEAMNQADEALYRAKHNGRNRIEMHGGRAAAA
jgi:diguanylate cyclase (GGDEF)-like protein/PAS domain S-box-containing protein